MEHAFTVDLISDLNLSSTDEFDWRGQPTSIFCVVAGNISGDLDKVASVLKHLSELYRGVFYIDGKLEHGIIDDYDITVDRIRATCKSLVNVIYLHNHVVILNKIAFVAINGWYDSIPNIEDEFKTDKFRLDDIEYLSMTIKSLQYHHDVEQIVVISSSTPSQFLNYDLSDAEESTKVEPIVALSADHRQRITHWLFGSGKLMVDQNIDICRYVNNHRESGQPYWPKRIEF